jgi:hypothetical protein
MALKTSETSDLDELKARAWKEKQAASLLLQLPKPILLLSGQVGKKPAPLVFSADSMEGRDDLKTRITGAPRPRPEEAEKIAIGRKLAAERSSLIEPNDLAANLSPEPGEWGRWTREQREEYTEQQAGRLLALDPARRVHALARMLTSQHDTPEHALIKDVMEHLPDEERRQVKEMVQREIVGRELDRRKLNEGK